MLHKYVERAAAASLLITIVFAVWYLRSGNGICETLAITGGTTCYHIVMRLLTGWTVPILAKNHLDWNGAWFRQKSFEPALYRRLRVKRWKNRMPTYIPESFSLKEHSPEEILRTMCESELVHEVIVVLSFLPLLFTLIWDSPAAFLITSAAAALFDCCFVVMQRYNRPRLIKVLEKNGGQRT